MPNKTDKALELSGRIAIEVGRHAFKTTTARKSGKKPPLHESVRNEISSRIASGEWPVGSVLPNENKLAVILGVSVGTLRRSLADLANDGLLTRHPKIGTTVTGLSAAHDTKDSLSLIRLQGQEDSLQDAENVLFGYERRRATGAEAEVLALAADASVHKFERLRRIGGMTVMRDLIVFDVRLAPDIRRIEDIPPMLALQFLERYGVRPSSIRERLSAELATAEDAAAFDRALPFAVMVIEEIALDQLGRPILWAWHRIITEKFRYINTIRK